MARSELPAGIERLLKQLSFSCSESEYVHFRQDVLRKWVSEVADAQENGWALLRQGAVEQLANQDPVLVERALSVLFVVGNQSDVAQVEPLLAHADERVRKAARTCIFEIRRRPENG